MPLRSRKRPEAGAGRPRGRRRGAPPYAVWLFAAALAGCAPEIPDADWDTWLGDPGRTRQSPLTAIDAANVAGLEVAWRHDTGELGDGVSLMETSPLVVGGTLYGLSPTLTAFALDAATGQPLWRREAGAAARGHAQRGLLWWPGGGTGGAAPRLFHVAGTELVALEPGSGELVPGFAEGGRLDLSRHVGGGAAVAGPGTVFENRILLGVRGGDGGFVLAVSAVDGALQWRTPTDVRAGGAPAAPMALDRERATAFVPCEAPAPGAYGPEPPGPRHNRSALVAVDARTGAERWRRAIYEYESWPGSLASPPVLMSLPRDGKPVPAVALATRRGDLTLWRRDDGEALHPWTRAGEPAQRVSAIALARQEFEPRGGGEAARSLLARPFAPPSVGGTLMFPAAGVGHGGLAWDAAAGRLIVSAQETASVLKAIEIPAGFSDRDAYIVHCARCHGGDRKGLYEGRADRYGAGGPSLVGVDERLSKRDIVTVIDRGRGSMPKFDFLGDLERFAIVRYLGSGPDDFSRDPRTAETSHVLAEPATLRAADRLPANAPPWGTLAAVDAATGNADWRVPFGEYPGRAPSGRGAENAGGAVVTASGLVFIAATPDMKLSAYDAGSGELLWQGNLSASGHGTPAVYAAGGRPFVVIAAGGGRLGPPSGSEYIAFSLSE